MQDAVNKILSIEEEATRRVEKARAEAEALLSGTETEAKAILERGRADAQAEAEALGKEIVRKGAEESRAIVAAADAKRGEASRLDPDRSSPIAALLLRELLKTED